VLAVLRGIADTWAVLAETRTRRLLGSVDAIEMVTLAPEAAAVVADAAAPVRVVRDEERVHWRRSRIGPERSWVVIRLTRA